MKEKGQTMQLVNESQNTNSGLLNLTGGWPHVGRAGTTPVTHTTAMATPSSPLSPVLPVCVMLMECLLRGRRGLDPAPAFLSADASG